MPVKPKRPYLLRAIHDWIVDSGMTPHLLVAVDSPRVQVPADYVSEGKIVLNIAPRAIRDLVIGDATICFSGRFGGVAFPVSVPIASVLAVFAKETGEGMMFDAEESAPDEGPETGPRPGKAHLTRIK